MIDYDTLIAELLAQYADLVGANAEHEHRVGVGCPGCRRIDLSRRLYDLESARDDVVPVKKPRERNAVSRRDREHLSINDWHERKKSETDELIGAVKAKKERGP